MRASRRHRRPSRARHGGESIRRGDRTARRLDLLFPLWLSLFCLSPSAGAADLERSPEIGFSPGIGFSIVDARTDRALPLDALLVRYRGPIAFPFVENLEALCAELCDPYATLVLSLDSEGGELGQTRRAATLLAQLRERLELVTLVDRGKRCLSACVPVFVQGERRLAAGASVWMFHGAHRIGSTRPVAAATAAFVELMRERGVSDDFLERLEVGGFLEQPGEYWLSGYELVHEHRADIITEMLTPWRSLPERSLPFDPQIRSR